MAKYLAPVLGSSFKASTIAPLEYPCRLNACTCLNIALLIIPSPVRFFPTLQEFPENGKSIYPAYGISVFRDHGISAYHCPSNSAYHFQKVDRRDRSAFPELAEGLGLGVVDRGTIRITEATTR